MRELGEQHHDALLLDEREVRRRAVGEQQSGFGDERARDRDALALAVGELAQVHADALLGLAGEQRLADPPLGAAVTAAIHEQRHRDVVEHAEALLPGLRRPHARDLATAKARSLRRRHPVKALPVVGDGAAIRLAQAGGDPQKRRLA